MKNISRHQNLIIEDVLNLSRDQNSFTRILFLVARQRIDPDGEPDNLFRAFGNAAGQPPHPSRPSPDRLPIAGVDSVRSISISLRSFVAQNQTLPYG